MKDIKKNHPLSVNQERHIVIALFFGNVRVIRLLKKTLFKKFKLSKIFEISFEKMFVIKTSFFILCHPTKFHNIQNIRPKKNNIDLIQILNLNKKNYLFIIFKS